MVVTVGKWALAGGGRPGHNGQFEIEEVECPQASGGESASHASPGIALTALGLHSARASVVACATFALLRYAALAAPQPPQRAQGITS